ncbi:MAG: BamA/TamA family outer membrane protein [Planctomycetes bacterium]|nr:BamA/TamA family outer membrane protein [Planctomycetota bacterium]MCB9919880.1 BamA/TamA family outer membrane protein [Planctomycetota bacterium]
MRTTARSQHVGRKEIVAGIGIAMLASCQSTKIEVVGDGPNARPVRAVFEGLKSFDARVFAKPLRPELIRLSQLVGDANEHERVDEVVDVARRAVQTIIVESGYPDAVVSAKLETPPALETIDEETSILRFLVREGPFVTIESIEFDGNHSLTSAELLGRQFGSTRGTTSIEGIPFVRADVDSLRDEITARYQGAGYLEANVAKPRIEFTRDHKARVRFEIREGPLYTVLRMRIDRALADRLATIPGGVPKGFDGKPFSAAEIEAYCREIVRGLREAGHPDPDIRPLIGAVAEEKGVDVLIRGEPGPIQAVGEVVVVGNDVIRQDNIRATLELEPGDRFRGSLEDRAIRRIYATGDFAKVQAKHETLPDGRLRIVLEVIENKRPPVDLEVGYGSYVRVRAGLRFGIEDVLSTGLDLKAAAELNAKGHMMSASLGRADVLPGTDATIGMAGMHRRQPSYSDKQLAVEAALRHEWTDTTHMRLGYRFEDHGGSWSDTSMPTLDVVDHERSVLFAQLLSQDRDHPIRTFDGHAAKLTLDWSDESLGGDVDLLHLGIDGAKWLRVSDRVALSARVRSGLVWTTRSSARIPIQHRMFVGGENTVRSFREDRVGPKDANGESLGGEFRNVFNLESRFVIEDPLDFVLFADAGNVGRRVEDFGLDDMRYAIGLGLQYSIPVQIPIRFDFAINPDRRSGEEKWVMHLRIGVLD